MHTLLFQDAVVSLESPGSAFVSVTVGRCADLVVGDDVSPNVAPGGR